MTDVREALFERELRRLLESRAGAPIPSSLAVKVAALGPSDPSAHGWLRRVIGVLATTLTLVLAVAVAAMAILGTARLPDDFTPGAGTERALQWQTQMATLEAHSLSIEAGGRTFAPPPDAGVSSDPGSSSYRTLEMFWDEAGIEMRLFIYFAANNNSWWVTQIRTYDASSDGDWIYYWAPNIQAALGDTYEGDVDLRGLGFGGVGRILVDDLRLTAFSSGTIPPSFNDCRGVGPTRGNPFGPPVGHEPHPDLSEFGIAEGMDAGDVHTTLFAQGICHEFRLEFPSINRGQIWCIAPRGNVREFAFGSAGQIIVFIEDPSRLPLDTELPQVVGC